MIQPKHRSVISRCWLDSINIHCTKHYDIVIKLVFLKVSKYFSQWFISCQCIKMKDQETPRINYDSYIRLGCLFHILSVKSTDTTVMTMGYKKIKYCPFILVQDTFMIIICWQWMKTIVPFPLSNPCVIFQAAITVSIVSLLKLQFSSKATLLQQHRNELWYCTIHSHSSAWEISITSLCTSSLQPHSNVLIKMHLANK